MLEKWVASKMLIKKVARSNSLLERKGLAKINSDGMPILSPLCLQYQLYLESLFDCLSEEVGFKKYSPVLLMNQELWNVSGRNKIWNKDSYYNADGFICAPTSEESFMQIFKENLLNQGSLPMMGYQIERKFRKEKRPYGLFRSRDFKMWDCYALASGKDEYNFDVMSYIFMATCRKMHRYLEMLLGTGKVHIAISKDGAMGKSALSYEMFYIHKDGQSKYLRLKQSNLHKMGMPYQFIAIDNPQEHIKKYPQDEKRMISGWELGHSFFLGEDLINKFFKDKLGLLNELIKQEKAQFASFGVGISRLMEVMMLKHEGLNWINANNIGNKCYHHVLIAKNRDAVEFANDLSMLRNSKERFILINAYNHLNPNQRIYADYFNGIPQIFQNSKGLYIRKDHKDAIGSSHKSLKDAIMAEKSS